MKACGGSKLAHEEQILAVAKKATPSLRLPEREHLGEFSERNRFYFLNNNGKFRKDKMKKGVAFIHMNQYFHNFVIVGITGVPLLLLLALFNVLNFTQLAFWFFFAVFIGSLLVFIFKFKGRLKPPRDREEHS